MCRPSKASEGIWDRISEVFSHLKMRNGILVDFPNHTWLRFLEMFYFVLGETKGS